MSLKSDFYRVIEEYRRDIIAQYGAFFDFEFTIDYDGRYPNKRDFAKTDGYVIFFSPKILTASLPQIEGLIAHEIAHTVFIKLGYDDHSEEETDMLAEVLFHKKIYYDDMLVQNTSSGIRPRPPYLPN